MKRITFIQQSNVKERCPSLFLVVKCANAHLYCSHTWYRKVLFETPCRVSLLKVTTESDLRRKPLTKRNGEGSERVKIGEGREVLARVEY